MPNVSFCEDTPNEVHYNPTFFCKLTLNDGSVVDIEGSGELTQAMITEYKTTCVSAEIGELCTSIGYEAFKNYTSLTDITIPNSVTSIGSYAFDRCTSLTSITIPNSVTSIGNWAFQDCENLSYVSIGNSVTSIGIRAFDGCSGLTSITIPNSVTSISAYTFASCSGLTSVTVEATTPPTLGIEAFYDTNNCPIYVPSSSVSDYQGATNWSTYASRIQAIQNE